MPAATPHTVGTVFLQVVPSYDGFFDSTPDLAREMDRQLAGEVERNHSEVDKALGLTGKRAGKKMGKAISDELDAELGTAGKDSADRYISQFERSLRPGAKKIAKALRGINFETASQKTIDRNNALADTFEKLGQSALKNRGDYKAAAAAYAQARKELEGFHNEAKKNDEGFNADLLREAVDTARTVRSEYDKIEVERQKADDRRKALLKQQEEDLKRQIKEAGRAADQEVRNSKRIQAEIQRETELREKARRAGAGVYRRALEDRLGQAAAALPENSTDRGINDARDQIRNLQERVIVEVDMDSKTAEIELRGILARLQAQAGRNDVEVDVRTDLNAASAPLARFLAGSNAIKGPTKELSTLERLNKKFSESSRDAANSFRAFNAVVLLGAALGPALIPVLGGIAGGLVAIGPAAVAAGSGLGVLLLGFQGVGEAFSALGDQSQDAGKDAKAAADTMRNAARAVADAEKNLARAREDAARSAQDSARRVREARERSAEGIRRAIKAEQDAEERLTDAKKDAAEAQRDLIKAREEAKKKDEDLDAQIRQAALDERQGVVDLFEATVQNEATQRDGSATNLDKEKSSIALEQARLSLEQIREEQARLAAEKARTDKQSIDGSEDVQAAIDKVKDANDDVKDAQEALGEASADVDKARAEGAEAVADALRDQARAQQDSAQAVADAALAVKRAQEDYSDAADKTSASTEKVNEAFAKLGPEAQAFALFLHGLRDEFGLLRDTAAAGFLPEVQAGIGLLMDKYFPGLLNFVETMSEALGQIATLTADVLAGPVMESFFATFADAAPDMAKVFSQTFLNWMQVFARLLELALPFAQDFGDALLRLSEKALDWATDGEAFNTFLEYVAAVGPHVAAFFGALVKAFFAIAEALTPVGLDILDGLTFFLNVLADMDPENLAALATAFIGMLVLFQVVNGLSALIAGFKTFGTLVTLGPGALIAVALAGFALAIYVLMQRSEQFREIVEQVWAIIKDTIYRAWTEQIKPALDGMAAAFDSDKKGMQEFYDVAGPLIILLADILGKAWYGQMAFVFTAFLIAVNSLTFAMQVLGLVFEQVEKIIEVNITAAQIYVSQATGLMRGAFKAVRDSFRAIGTVIDSVYQDYIAPTFQAIVDWLTGKGSLSDVFDTAVAGISAVWATLQNVFKTPLRFLIETVINGGLIKGFNDLSGKVGGPQIKNIEMPAGLRNASDEKPRGGGGKARNEVKLATGGFMPGYTPGRDVHRFVSPTGGVLELSGGEPVLRPEAGVVLGSEWVHGVNAAARNKGIAGVREYLGGQRLATGGYWHRPGTRSRHSGYNFARWAGDINVPGAGDYGNPVKPYRDGVVSQVKYIGDRSYGRYIVINHPETKENTLYAHLSKTHVRPGDVVKRGETLIGNVGNEGKSSGPHLHFEIRGGSAPIDASSGGGGLLSTISSKIQSAVLAPAKYLKGKLAAPIKKLTEKFGNSDLMQAFAAVPRKLVSSMASYAKSKLSGLVNQDDNDNGTTPNLPKGQAGNVRKYTPQVEDALTRLDQPLSLVPHVLRRMNQESGGNPRAINNWDSNAAKGTPSVGLMQVIAPTFRANARGFRNTGPFLKGVSVDPLANIYAGLHYARGRYAKQGGIRYAMDKPGGYKDGGIIGHDAKANVAGHTVPDNGVMMYDQGGMLPPGLTSVLNLTGKPEPVYTHEDDPGRTGGRRDGYDAPMVNHFHEVMFTPGDAIDELNQALRTQRRTGRYGGND